MVGLGGSGRGAPFGCPAQTKYCRAFTNGYSRGGVKVPPTWRLVGNRYSTAPDLGRPCTEEEGCSACKVLEVDHGRIVCEPKPGVGAVLDVVVAMNQPVDLSPCAAATGAFQNGRSVCAYSAPAQNATFGFEAPNSISFTAVASRSSRLDAVGEQIFIKGANFGDSSSFVEVLMNGRPCTAPQWKDAAKRSMNCEGFECEPSFTEPFVVCNTPDDVVGEKQVTITVALQRVTLQRAQCGAPSNATVSAAARAELERCERLAAVPVLETECKPGSFGEVGRLCALCPFGAVCAGGTALPVAQQGFYKLNPVKKFTSDGRLNADYMAMPSCVKHNQSSCLSYVAPCEPPEACTENNVCEVGYTAERCKLCAPGYYKLSGVCEKCPECPRCIFALVVLAIIVLAIMGHVLTRKRIDLGILTIGVDYAQVLSILAMSNHVQWPEDLKRLFNIFSFANLNLDLLAPECSYPQMPYENKWAFIMLLPLLLVSVGVLAHVAKYLHKRCVLRRTQRLHSHGHLLVGTFMMSFYYCYLYVTKTTLDIFNCSPTTPPEGNPPKTYLEVTFVECHKAGGLHLRLLPWASFFFMLYTAGFPALVALIFAKNRRKIKEDQILRARGTGTTRETNPNCYELRKRYKKLYYQFKPENYYWILVIIGRKFLIAASGLLFRKVPVFLLAFSLMVLFSCYTLQVKYSPYMSLSERQGVIERHEAAMGDIVGVMKAAEEKRKRGRKAFKFGSKETWEAGILRESAFNYFWNYNTVESTLLFSACLVLLNGLMFQSQKIVPGGKWERGLLIWTMFIIITSVLYFAAVLISEVVVGLGLLDKRRAKKMLGHGDLDQGGATKPRAESDTMMVHHDLDVVNPLAVEETTLTVEQTRTLVADNKRLATAVELMTKQVGEYQKALATAQIRQSGAVDRKKGKKSVSHFGDAHATAHVGSSAQHHHASTRGQKKHESDKKAKQAALTGHLTVSSITSSSMDMNKGHV